MSRHRGWVRTGGQGPEHALAVGEKAVAEVAALHWDGQGPDGLDDRGGLVEEGLDEAVLGDVEQVLHAGLFELLGEVAAQGVGERGGPAGGSAVEAGAGRDGGEQGPGLDGSQGAQGGPLGDAMQPAVGTSEDEAQGDGEAVVGERGGAEQIPEVDEGVVEDAVSSGSAVLEGLLGAGGGGEGQDGELAGDLAEHAVEVGLAPLVGMDGARLDHVGADGDLVLARERLAVERHGPVLQRVPRDAIPNAVGHRDVLELVPAARARRAHLVALELLFEQALVREQQLQVRHGVKGQHRNPAAALEVLLEVELVVVAARAVLAVDARSLASQLRRIARGIGEAGRLLLELRDVVLVVIPKVLNVARCAREDDAGVDDVVQECFAGPLGQRPTQLLATPLDPAEAAVATVEPLAVVEIEGGAGDGVEVELALEDVDEHGLGRDIAEEVDAGVVLVWMHVLGGRTRWFHPPCFASSCWRAVARR